MGNDQKPSSGGKLKITSLEDQYNIEAQNYRKELKEAKSNTFWKVVLAIFIMTPILGIIVPCVLLATCTGQSFSSCNSKKYSLNDIAISVVKKENDIERSVYINGKAIGIYFNVTNNGKQKLSEICGEMKVYLGEDKYLMAWSVNLSDYVEVGETKQMVIKCDAKSSDEMNAFYDASLSELKITYTISYAYFGTTASDITKVVGTDEERVIKPYKKNEALVLQGEVL